MTQLPFQRQSVFLQLWNTCLNWRLNIFDANFSLQNLKVQCWGFRGIFFQKWNVVFIIMFNYVYKHLKLRIVLWNNVGCLPRSLAHCTAMFLQKPRMDKPNTCSKEGLSFFFFFSRSHRWFSTWRVTPGEFQLIATCSLTTRCSRILHTGHF